MGVRGATVKMIEAGCARRQPGQRRDDIGGFVVDQRVHRHDMVDIAEIRVQHVADTKIDRAIGNVRRHTLAGDVDQAGRDIHRNDFAPRRAASKDSAPGAASGVQQAACR